MTFRDIKLTLNWTVREIISPIDGMLPRKYYYKRTEAPQTYLTSRRAKQLAGFQLIETDLRNTIIWLKQIEDIITSEGIDLKSNDPQIHFPNPTSKLTIKALWVASLTFYGKAFSSSDGRKTKLSHSFIDTIYHESHDIYIHMRNNFAAHSGTDGFEEARVTLILPPNKKTNEIPLLYTEKGQQNFIYKAGGYSLLQLAEHVYSKVENKIRSLDGEIMREEVIPQGVDYWYKIAKKSNL